jgi:two-component system response regulator HydG
VRAEWPGNVRELENAIESALALAPGPRLRVQDFRRARPAALAAPDTSGLPLSLLEYERAALERALRECRGDARAAARRLGIGRSTLYRKLARFGLRTSERGAGPVRGMG